MARSPASNSLEVVVAAAMAWLAVATVLLAMPVARPVERVRHVAAHRSDAGVAWAGADRVYAELELRARALGRDERVRLARVILEEASRAELAPLLVLAVIRVESGFNPRAVSPVGAIGLMQLMPPTFREQASRARIGGSDPFDPLVNVRAGVRYLSRLVGDFEDVELALMAYNAGPNRIRRYLEAGGVPARFLGYARDVLREVERHAPRARPALVPGVARTLLATSHPRRPLLDGAAGTSLHHRGASPAGAVPATPLLAALDQGAAAVSAALALADTEPAPPVRPPDARPSRDACVRLDPALPMVRGRDPGAPDEWTSAG